MSYPIKSLNFISKLYYIGCLKHKYYVYNKQKNKSGSRSVQIIQKIKGRNKIFKIIGCATTQQEEDDKEKNSIFNKFSIPNLYYIYFCRKFWDFARLLEKAYTFLI